MDLARMLLRTSLMAASFEGNFTKQNGDLTSVSKRPHKNGSETHTWVVRKNLQLDALKHC